MSDTCGIAEDSLPLFSETFGAVPLEVEPSSALGSDCKALPEVAELPVCCEDADQMNVELYVRYDPSVLQAEFLTDKEDEYINSGSTFYTANDRAAGYHLLRLSPVDDVNKDVIEDAVCDVITRLPFNGEYRNSDLLAAVQAINGIEVADICKVEVCAASSTGIYTPVVGYRRPYSGYYTLTSLVVKGKPYVVAE